MKDESEFATFLGMTKVQFLGAGLALLAVATAMALALLAFAVDANRDLARSTGEQAATSAQLNDRTRRALDDVAALAFELKTTQCALKDYAQDQVEETADFLSEGRSIPGITQKELIDSLSRLRTYRDAFSAVDCS
jgi:hypothetical protein